MQDRSTQESLVLPAGSTRSFVFAGPTRVHVNRGCVWLTVSGMPDDYWMRDGDTLDLPAQRQIVIEAHKSDSLLSFVKAEQDLRCRAALQTAVCAES